MVINTTATPITAGTTIYPADTIAMHPDNAGTFSVLRWIAPSTGLYAISTTFSDIDNGVGTEATVDVHVLRNGVSLFSNTLSNVTTSTPFNSGNLSLTSGEIIDFIVGNGGNGYNNDHTAITAQIMAVPEPSTFALLALGGGLGLLQAARKRRRS